MNNEKALDIIWSLYERHGMNEKELEAIEIAAGAIQKRIPKIVKTDKNVGHCECTPLLWVNLSEDRYCSRCGQLLRGIQKSETQEGQTEGQILLKFE